MRKLPGLLVEERRAHGSRRGVAAQASLKL